MGPTAFHGVLPLVGLSLLVPAAFYTVTHPDHLADRVAMLWARLRRPGPQVSAHRPVEDLVGEVRRLGRRFHANQRSHVKAESLRHTYDRVLGETCSALGIEHLLGVLEPGPELDRERTRVERLLHRWGVDLTDLDDAA